jgi:hypothetical protein
MQLHRNRSLPGAFKMLLPIAHLQIFKCRRPGAPSSRKSTQDGCGSSPKRRMKWAYDLRLDPKPKKTDTAETRRRLGQKSGAGNEDDAQEGTPRRADRGGTAAGGSGIASGQGMSQGGISQATYCLWKRNYSGVGVSELRELRQLRQRSDDGNGWWRP